MNIHITSGTGTGPTKLAAFDAALHAAGIANFNLLRLSSVIPPNSRVITDDHDIDEPSIDGEWGDRLYVVMAAMHADTPNTDAWAGIGWVQDEATGKGLFVEHEGYSEQSVRDDITKSLQALMETRGTDFGHIHMRIQGQRCSVEPVCALVAAVYQTEAWHKKTYPV